MPMLGRAGRLGMLGPGALRERPSPAPINQKGVLGLLADVVGRDRAKAQKMREIFGESGMLDTYPGDRLFEQMASQTPLTGPPGDLGTKTARAVAPFLQDPQGLLTGMIADVAWPASLMPRRAPGTLGATVYHASPHKFDRFDASKIGTGEGAQVFGHGMYTAGNPATGIEYLKQFTERAGGAPVLKVGHKYLDPWDVQTWEGIDTGLIEDVATRKLMGESKDQALESVRQKLSRQREEWGLWDDQSSFDELDELRRIMDPDSDDFAIDFDELEIEHPAHFYRADLDDDSIPKMLDWDKELINQPEGVQEALKEVYPELFQEYYVSHQNGHKMAVAEVPEEQRAIYEQLLKAGHLYKDIPAQHYMGYHVMKGSPGYPKMPLPFDTLEEKLGSAAAVADFLGQRDVPGVQYLDELSRDMAEGGTHNYVTFPSHEHLLKILERK